MMKEKKPANQGGRGAALGKFDRTKFYFFSLSSDQNSGVIFDYIEIP